MLGTFKRGLIGDVSRGIMLSEDDALRVVFMGTPQFALPVLSALERSGCDIVGVYTQPDRRSGRGRRLVAPPIKQAAEAHGLAVFQPTSLRRDDAARQRLAALQPHLIVVAAYGIFLPVDTLGVPPMHALNIHPSLLPKYRGASPVAAAIINGDAFTGVSIIQLDAGMDSGPIAAQRQTRIGADETAESLTTRLFEMGAELLSEILPLWGTGGITPMPQSESDATFTRLLSREDGVIDWSRSAAYIARQVRAYYPWPGSFTHWDAGQVKILQASAVEGQENAIPGTVVALRQGVGIATGEGVLLLLRLQLEGRQALSAHDFVRGYGGFIGSLLGKK